MQDKVAAMQSGEHLQLAEVVEFLNAKKACAIVYPQRKYEVGVTFDGQSMWHVQTRVFGNTPDPAVVKKLEAANLKTRRHETQLQFGPNRGKVIESIVIAGDFADPQTAARVALSTFETLWDLPPTEWLWVTAEQHDDRDQPQRPAVWPPSGV
jgi:hypothetical protein